LEKFKILILFLKNQFTPSWFCPHTQTFRCAIPTSSLKAPITSSSKIPTLRLQNLQQPGRVRSHPRWPITSARSWSMLANMQNRFQAHCWLP